MKQFHLLINRFSPFITIVIVSFLALESLSAQGQHFIDETATRLPERIDDTTDAVFGDLDGDADIDVIVSTSSAAVYRAYFILNNGAGYFPEDSLKNLFIPNYNFSSVSIGDLERDGDLDLLFSAYFDKIQLLIKNTEGEFVNEGESRLPGHTGAFARDDALIDVDNDLFLDISIVQYAWDWLWINNGWGYFDFFPHDRFPSGLYNGNAVAWGDVDGDYDLDCVIANNTGHPNLLMINDGTGWFSDETAERIPEDLEQSNGVSLVDLDNDSDLDIVVANGFSPGYNKIWINDGNGYFADETDLRLPQNGNASSGVSFGDIDNDYDMDLLISNRTTGGDANKVLVNNGMGYFDDETSTRYPDLDDNTTEIKLGDVDLDGDLDCYVVNIGETQYGEQNRLLINQSIPDSFPPKIPRTYHHPDTGDTSNPYLITTTVWDNISIVIGELNVSLLYRVFNDPEKSSSDVEFTEIPMLDCGGFLFRERIPAQSSVSTVEYYIKAKDRMGNVSYDPPNAPDSVFSFVVDVDVGINDNPASGLFPKAFSLSQNYPNPFNPSTTIAFDIPGVSGEKQHVEVTVYDIRGRRVRTLIDSDLEPGSHKLHWNGRNDRGESVPSGIYLYALRAGGEVYTRKMMVLK
jgi:hypothetical protein